MRSRQTINQKGVIEAAGSDKVIKSDVVKADAEAIKATLDIGRRDPPG